MSITHLVVEIKWHLGEHEQMRVHRWPDDDVPVEEVFGCGLLREAVIGPEVIASYIDVSVRHLETALVFGVWIPAERTVEDVTWSAAGAVPWRRRRLSIVDNVPIT